MSALRRPILALEEAVSRYVGAGQTVYLGNFGAQLFSVGHEVIRQGIRDLDLVLASGGLLLDQLLGAGTARSATFGHCWSPVGPSPAWNFRRAAEAGSDAVELHEVSLGILTASLTAGAWGVPFMPFPALAGTGYADEDWTGGLVADADSPWGSSPIVRAVAADVAFVHADLADQHGNAVIRGPLGEAVAAAQGARDVVVVAEEVLPPGARADNPTVPGLLVSAVVEQPGAVWPDGAIGRYDRDVAAYESYVDRARTVEGFAAWMHELTTPDPIR